jgi:hypothetical protein
MLDVTKQEAALDQWVDSNLTNYVKNEMATPNDSIRLFIEKREQEIAGKYAKDLERAKRMEERAAQEIDPRRKANLTRQSKKMYEEADLEREYAMQHTSHLPKDLQNPEKMWTPDDLAELRKREGFPEEGMGKSPNSQMWEQMADQSVYPNKAGDIQQYPAQQAKRKEALDEYLAYERELDDKLVSYLYKKGFDDNSTQALLKMPSTEKANILGDKKLAKLFDAIPPYYQNEHFLEIAGKENPWISKLDPKTNVYSGEASSLDLDHVVDVLKQDLAAKRIRPEQLNKLSIEQAVRRTTEFDREMADKMRAAVIKNQEGFPVHKDYGEEGYKWMELTVPKAELPEGYKILPDISNHKNPGNEMFSIFDPNGNMHSTGATEAEALNLFRRSEREQQLADALKYEGETMGHCVGGYCPDVIAGKSRIYSLRDAKGQPHVTVEVKPNEHLDYNSWFNKQPEEIQNKIAQRRIEDKNHDIYEGPEYLAAREALSPTIVQIKGKQNAKPKEDYIPYVQDFVRSGNWSGVGDFKNTDLIDANAIRKAGWDMKGVDKKYFTKQEYDDFLLAELNRVEGNKDGGAIHMQAGGVAGGINLLKKLGTAGAKLTKAEEAALRAPNVMNYADPLAPATMRMSEALGNAGAEGKTLNFTEADRSRVFGSNRGGVGFSGLQHYSEPHKEANTVWGFGNKLTADKKVKQNDPEKNLWTTFVGAPTQHKSNTVVLQDAVKEFQDAVKTGNVHPEQIKLMNNRIRAAKDEKTGSLLFDSKYDLTDPSALSVANSFARRSAIGDVLLGEGVKGQMRRKAFKEEHGSPPWKDAGKIEDILKRETDPDLVNAGTFDVGNRLFVMDNGVIHRPDLNVAFPYQVTGNDLGMKFELTPKEIAMRDWMKQYEAPRGKTNKVTPPSYMDLARNNPSQFVDEDYLTFLQKQGKKDGGSIQAKPFHDFDQIMSRAKGGAVDKPKTWLHALNNHQHKMACGGSVCDNTTPDITDSGNINYGGQYAQGGIV